MLFALLAALAQTPPEKMSLAERDTRAKELYQNGSTLYEEGLYEDAIAAFQESYRFSGLHPLLLNTANCYERLARYEDAIAVLNRYRAYARPPERDAIESRIRENQRRMEATPGYTPKPIEALPIPPLRPPLERPPPTDEGAERTAQKPGG